MGSAADLQGITATWSDATAANRLRYYLTVTGHGLRPWVGSNFRKQGHTLRLYRALDIGCIRNSCLCNLFTNVNLHL